MPLGSTQTASVERLGVTLPRLSELMRGKVSCFNLDTLVEPATRAGLATRVEVDRAA